MAGTLSISEVSRRSGFARPALRYYEQIGLLPAPERTGAGYRAYDEDVLPRLALVARAKLLGCRLDEIAALMPGWDGGRCRPVQDGLGRLAATKLDDARRRIVELEAFAAELERSLATLGSHTPDGPCDADCGCLRPAPAAGAPSAAPASAPIACSLGAAELSGRVADWQALLAHVHRRVPVDGGVRLEFGEDASVADVARLVTAEQSCCPFFAFAVTVDGRGLALEVRAPAEARSLVDDLFATG